MAETARVCSAITKHNLFINISQIQRVFDLKGYRLKFFGAGISRQFRALREMF